MEQQAHVFEVNPYELPRWREFLAAKRPEQRFLIMYAPVLEFAFQHLLQERQKHSKVQSLLSAELLLEVFKKDMIKILLPIYVDPLVFELTSLSKEGILKGDSPEERFDYFLRVIQSKTFIESFIAKYPVVADVFDRTLSCYLHSVGRFYADLEGHFHLVKSLLLVDFQPTKLVGCEASSATSCTGARVFILTFSNAKQETKRVIYKPRSLGVDIAFQHYLAWLNKKQRKARFRVLTFVNGGDHGWSEYAEHLPCENVCDIRTYYYKLGMLSASLYFFNARDIHVENIIAQGTDPILIDLEALLTPLLKKHNGFRSVLESLLLPDNNKIGPYFSGCDSSGMGGEAGQDALNKIPFWQNPGRDDMTRAYEARKTKAVKNKPYLTRPDEFECSDYADEFRAGFKAAYELWLKHRDELLSKQSVLNTFAPTKARVLLRSNRFYDEILQRCYMPYNLMQNKRYLQCFADLKDIVKQHPEYKSVIESEKADLYYGDVPYFYSHACRACIYNSEDEATDFPVKIAGLDYLRERLVNQFGKQDLAMQLQLIDSCFKARRLKKFGEPIVALLHTSNEQWRRQTKSLLQQISKQLLSQSITIEGRLFWNSLQLEWHHAWRQIITTQDVASGNLGIAPVLSRMGQSRVADTLAHVLTTFAEQNADGTQYRWQRFPGLLDGMGGVLWQLQQLGVEIKSEVNAWTKGHKAKLKNDFFHDVATGTAGMLLVMPLLRAQWGRGYKSMQRALVTSILDACPEPAVFPHQKEREQIGEFEVQNRLLARPLVGYGGGVAGIAAALAQNILPEHAARQQDWITAAVDYIDQQYVLGSHVWRYEYVGQAPQTAFGYYAGAVGVGFGMLQLPSTPLVEKQLQRAVNATVHSIYANQTPNLCCGVLGAMDFLLCVQALRPDLFSPKQFAALRCDFVQSIKVEDYAQLGSGFAYGLSGLGYVLQRLLDPSVACQLAPGLKSS